MSAPNEVNGVSESSFGKREWSADSWKRLPIMQGVSYPDPKEFHKVIIPEQ